MKAVTASLLAISVASFAPQSVACWWPGQALKRYFGSSDAITAPSDTVSPYEANDVIYNTTYAPTGNMVTRPQTQETTGLSLEPLLSANGTDALPTDSRPFDDDSSVPVTLAHAEAIPETTETTAQVTTKGLVTTYSPPLFAPDENLVPASGTFGDSTPESYVEDDSIAQETAVSSQSAALTTSERHMTDATLPATSQTLAPESTNGHTSTLANEIQFHASTSVTTTDRLATISYVDDDTSALSNEGIVDATTNMTTSGQPATATYEDDHTSALANEATTNIDSSGLPATASTGDDGTEATLFTLTTREAAPVHPSPAEDASNFVADAKDHDAKQTTVSLPDHGSATIATQVVDSTVFLLQTSLHEGQSTTDGNNVAIAESLNYATETSTGQPATTAYMDVHTLALENEAATSTDTTSLPAVASTNDNDTISNLFTLPTSEAAPIHASPAEDASNLVADAKDDDNDDAKQTTASVPDHGSPIITTQVVDSTSRDEVQPATDGDTVATAENSSYTTETAMLKTASMSVTGLLDAPVTREGLKVTAVASNSNNSASSATVRASSVTEPMAESTTIHTLSSTARYIEETDEVTSSSASTDTSVTMRSNADAFLAESMTQLNYASSREDEIRREDTSAEELGTTGPSFYSLSKVPELNHEDANDRSTPTAPTSVTRRYKPAYVRRFTPWVISRSPSSLAITSPSSPTSSPLSTARPQVDQDTLKAQESFTIGYVPTTNTSHMRRYQKDPTSMQGMPVTSTVRARIPPSDTLVVPESFFGSRSLFNRFGQPYCPGCDALLIKLPARFSIPRIPPYIYG
ncbi:uncharacterized protein [Dermacentor andersoni]|uniref:uncharacterized protein n=1 Tax=Dermacentor andersoni TaxID=34620 RepID=UPI002155B273|nr:mucin-4-like [Dermacentor andersoni]